MLGSIHVGGNSCLRGAVLNTFARMFISGFGRCCKPMINVHFGHVTWQNLSPLMACRISERLVNVGSLAGTRSNALIASTIISTIHGPTGCPPAENDLEVCRPGLLPSRSLRQVFLRALARGATEWRVAIPALSFSTATDLHFSRFPAHRSTDFHPIFQPICQHSLKAADLTFQSGDSSDLSLPSDRIFRSISF
jgi:hypothetical protein